MCKIVLVLAFFMIACSPTTGIDRVSIKDYSNLPKCWTTDGKEIDAFLIFGSSSEGYYPYLISKKCDPIVPGYGEGRGVVQLFSTIPISAIKMPQNDLSFHDRAFMANLGSHLALPEEGSPVYSIRGSLERDKNLDVVAYQIIDVVEFRKTGKTMQEFLDTAPSERR